jgi:hypothetical protein
MGSMGSLPENLRRLFWDQDFDLLTWEEDSDAVTARVLQTGNFDSLLWLRRRLGDGALREWILRRRGRGLDARRLRYWQTILDLPAEEVDRWVEAPERKVWERR